jgi:type II secretion system protein H
MLRKAFSLVELVLVMAITGVMAAIAIPRYAQASQRHQVEAAARRLMSDLEFAQRRARLCAAPRTVRFDLTESSYTIVQEAPLKASETAYVVRLSQEPYRAVIASSTLSPAVSPSVNYNGFGYAALGGTVTLRVGSYTRVIVIDPGFALPRLQ